MSAVTQSQALAVLRDLIEEAGGRVDDEVRVELARWLPRLQIATRWQGRRTRCDAGSGVVVAETWARLDGGYRGRVFAIAGDDTDDYSPTFETEDGARAWCDVRLEAAGWALAPEEGA